MKAREIGMEKAPGISETLDWATALMGLDVKDLRAEPEALHDSLMCLLKTQEDQAASALSILGRRAATIRSSLAIKIWESEDLSAEEKERHIFDEDFLG